jgi:hypothetical protein
MPNATEIVEAYGIFLPDKIRGEPKNADYLKYWKDYDAWTSERL